jgi:hypothetical protein
MLYGHHGSTFWLSFHFRARALSLHSLKTLIPFSLALPPISTVQRTVNSTFEIPVNPRISLPLLYQHLGLPARNCQI